MARITIITDTCQRKASPDCEGEFSYERKPGRPPVACKACRTSKAIRIAGKSVSSDSRPTEGTCGCGNKFVIQPRGRISNRCENCRTSGTVWRMDADGDIAMIHASQIAREEQERKDAAGDERALALFERMQPLLEKKNREVIVH